MSERKIQHAIGLRIKELRQKLFSSASDAAKRYSVTPQAWSDIETGRNMPKADRLLALAAFLDCTASHLLGEDIDAEAPITIPTWPTGGGIHWQVAEGVEPYDTPIPRGMIGFEVHGDSMVERRKKWPPARGWRSRGT